MTRYALSKQRLVKWMVDPQGRNGQDSGVEYFCVSVVCLALPFTFIASVLWVLFTSTTITLSHLGFIITAICGADVLIRVYIFIRGFLFDKKILGCPWET